MTQNVQELSCLLRVLEEQLLDSDSEAIGLR